jgi:hypothetical protein
MRAPGRLPTQWWYASHAAAVAVRKKILKKASGELEVDEEGALEPVLAAWRPQPPVLCLLGSDNRRNRPRRKNDHTSPRQILLGG